MGAGKRRNDKMTRFEAVCEALTEIGPGPFSASALFDRVKAKGAWTDGGIWIEIAAMVVNLPANWHWGRAPIKKEGERKLFLRPDGKLERYDEQRHGRFHEGERVDAAAYPRPDSDGNPQCGL